MLYHVFKDKIIFYYNYVLQLLLFFVYIHMNMMGWSWIIG